MRIAVIGAGGTGGYFGGRLAQAGEDVIFIARGAHLEALRTHGLRVESPKGDLHLRPVQATDDPAQAGPADVVLVTVKTWQLPEAVEAARPLLGPDTCVVPLQNGVEAPALLAERLGPQHAAGGLCAIISAIVEPGHVRHAGMEPLIQFGELDNRPSERLQRLRDAFARAGVQAEIPADIHAALWMKLLLISPWSGLGAVTRSPAGVWRSLPETRRMVQQSIEEIGAVARARGVALPADAAAVTLSRLDGLPPEATSSLQRDMAAGRPSELEAQLGVITRLGKQTGVPTPLHDFLYASLLAGELRAQGRITFPGPG